MPLPPMPDIFRCQVQFPHKSGLARDAMVNVFHFRNDGELWESGQIADKIRDVLLNFYCEPAPNGEVLTGRMSAQYNAPVLRIYDLGKPEPREPQIRSFTGHAFAAPSGPLNNSIPTECAAVVTWDSAVIAPKVGTMGKPGRGRTFLGGLTTQCLAQDATTSKTVLAPAYRTGLAQKAAQLIDPDDGVFELGKPQLVVLSTRYLETDIVDRGWVDNAVDTQRRRGTEATARTLFTAEAVPPN